MNKPAGWKVTYDIENNYFSANCWEYASFYKLRLDPTEAVYVPNLIMLYLRTVEKSEWKLE